MDLKLNPNRKKRNKGFTLIELIVVIGILLILSAIAVVSFGNIMESARKATRHADATVLMHTLNRFNIHAVTQTSQVRGMSQVEENRFGVIGDAPWGFITSQEVWAADVSGNMTINVRHINNAERTTGIMDFDESVTMSAENMQGILRASLAGTAEPGWAFIRFYNGSWEVVVL